MFKRLLQVSTDEFVYFIACLQYRIKAGRHVKHKVLVNGGMKTGTTWMLKMVANVPGYHGVGNFLGDKSRFTEVKPGEIVHGHLKLSPELKEILTSCGFRVILMIRDPRDQLVSHVFHAMRVKDAPLHAKLAGMTIDDALLFLIENRKKEGEKRSFRGVVENVEITNSWLAEQFTLPVKYEDLQSDPVHELEKALGFIGIEVDRPLLRAIVKRNRFERLATGKYFWKSPRRPGEEDRNSHFRKGIIGDWKNYFNETHIRCFKDVAGMQLIQLGYEQDNNW